MATRHAEIARHLRERIEDGTYPPGANIPPISELMEQWGVARDTVRDAVSRLMHEGLVVPRRGVGTVVRDSTPVALAYEPERAAAVWADQAGESSSDQVIQTGWVNADPGVAARLAIPQGSPVVHRLRHQSKGSAVAQIHEQWIPEQVVVAIREAASVDLADTFTPPTDLFSLMRQAGHSPRTATETVHARMPQPDEAELMDMAPGVPVLVTVRLTRNAAALETSTVTASGDRLSLSFTVPLER